MTVPGGARTTLRTAYCCTHVRGTPVSIMGRSSYRGPLGAPALRFAPPGCPKPSPTLTPAVLMLCARPQTAEGKLQGQTRSWLGSFVSLYSYPAPLWVVVGHAA